MKGPIQELVDDYIKMLCQREGCGVEELNVQEDHIHLLVSPQKVSISRLRGMLNGKIAIKLFRSYPKLRQRPYRGNHFWARDYFVSTVGLDEDTMGYIKHQEKEEREIEGQ